MFSVETLRKEVQDVVVNNILRFWLDKMQDRENGGFYGRVDANEVLHPEAEKGAILNARILWSFSAAYRVLSSLETLENLDNLEPLEDYLAAATRAKEYFIDHREIYLAEIDLFDIALKL